MASQLVVMDEFSVEGKAELRRVDSFIREYDEAEKAITDHSERENALGSATEAEKDEGHESTNDCGVGDLTAPVPNLATEEV